MVVFQHPKLPLGDVKIETTSFKISVQFCVIFSWRVRRETGRGKGRGGGGGLEVKEREAGRGRRRQGVGKEVREERGRGSGEW